MQQVVSSSGSSVHTDNQVVDASGHSILDTTRPGAPDNSQQALPSTEPTCEQIVGNLKAQLREYELENEKLRQALEDKIHELNIAIGDGAYNTATTRILQMQDNPDSQEHAIRLSTLQRMRQENDELLVALHRKQNPNGGGEASEEMVPRQSLLNAQDELRRALAALKQKEILELRLKKGFQDKADEVRRAVQSLLGYRLDFLSSGRVKATSIYAPSADHAFLFGSSGGGLGTMEVLSPGFGDDIKGLVKYWAEERGSIPNLLASLTGMWYEENMAQLHDV